jgi:hypothetical protein
VIELENINPKRFAHPTFFQWTYGSNWINAQRLPIGKSLFDGDPESPALPKQMEDLKFEFIFGTLPSVSLIGFSASAFDGFNVQMLLIEIDKVVRSGAVLRSLLVLIKRHSGRTAPLSHVVVGVFDEWLQNTRLELGRLTSEIFTSTATASKIRGEYSAGVKRPLMLELYSPVGGLWAAWSISTADDGRHFFDVTEFGNVGVMLFVGE